MDAFIIMVGHHAMITNDERDWVIDDDDSQRAVSPTRKD
jgi:hypothetical protein